MSLNDIEILQAKLKLRAEILTSTNFNVKVDRKIFTEEMLTLAARLRQAKEESSKTLNTQVDNK